ncbi:extracellular solute-binding protein [Paenibacillus sp. LHD-117]|uniref:ABC transporter substrate-binding protein n=1 Tax=Paenibacillus sp. LHD-117 TaxID=3071412 RepID=UPI0027DF98C5|nr:extracellular solute-binding protein [Paenibacillus sp. LHD-117]MDQ6417989.1 extracellular solute-binding protein [Paenibacillus sp. LHD-117]
MKPTKHTIVALGLAAIVGLTSACGSSNNNGNADSQNGNTSSQNAANAPADSEQPKENVTISLLTDNTQDAVNTAKAAIEAFQAKYPYIKVEHETRPSGGEGDNFVKTRLATGDMNDVFFYNSGSLMQALNPEANLLDLSEEPFMDRVQDSFKTTVTYNGKIYAGPAGAAMGGGWFYNKKVYADLGLSVPKTWDELMANNETIKAAGITPVIGTFKDDWTSQLIVLADYYNVQAQQPTFADDYTNNKIKFANNPATLRSFEKLQEVFDKGYMNKDFLATNYDTGLKMLAEGTGAHYPMLSFAVPAWEQNYADKMGDIGFFAQPGDSEGENGLTVWMPGGAYISKNSKHIEEAKLFVDFVASVEGMKVWATVSKPSGPYVVDGAVMPDDVAPAVQDMLPYFESGKNAPALEFVSPIKGPSLPQITTEVGGGIKSAKEGAAAYDKDVVKQAQQLGLAGW